MKLKVGWPNYRFKKRRSLLNFAIQEVVIDVMSTHWVKIEVLWLHEEWGREKMYYRRRVGGSKQWSDEEKAILQEHYATMPRLQLMELLPDRGWEAMFYQAKAQGLSRPNSVPRSQWVGGDTRYSYRDIQFIRKENISDYGERTKWEKVW